jgi:multidrug efflux pump subunit AcrA (membrane-fusion protein)
MAIEVDMDNKEHVLKPGMFANVMLIVNQRPNEITVPTAALLKDDQGSFVFTAVGDSARLMRIERGIDQGDRTEVLRGLNDSSKVIVLGQQFVRDHGPVNIQR